MSRWRAQGGRWIHYPWRDLLVRVLSPEGFARLRAHRRGAPMGGDRLGTARILVLGLEADALSSLVLRGVGGTFLLANPDHLSLSRSNRIQAGTRDIGASRAVSVARRIRELDPYAGLEVRLQGDTPEDLETLVREVDLVLGSCEDPQIAYLSRVVARRARVPVVMQVGDSVLEVDRFDQDDDRPLQPGALPRVRCVSLVQHILLGGPYPSGSYQIGASTPRPVHWVGVAQPRDR